MSSLTQDENKELVHTNLDLIKYSTESFQNEKSIFNIFQSNYSTIEMNQSENLKSFNPDTHYYKDEFSLPENKKEKKIEKNETKKDKLYSLKSTKTNEIQSSNISLKTIFISQARVHPILLPMKYRNFIDKMHVLTKCNVGVLFFTIYTLFKRDRFVITQSLYNKSVFAFSIWYFSFLFLCLKMDSTYAEAYENVSSRYTEEEIIKLINDYSKTFKISV